MARKYDSRNNVLLRMRAQQIRAAPLKYKPFFCRRRQNQLARDIRGEERYLPVTGALGCDQGIENREFMGFSRPEFRLPAAVVDLQIPSPAYAVVTAGNWARWFSNSADPHIVVTGQTGPERTLASSTQRKG